MFLDDGNGELGLNPLSAGRSFQTFEGHDGATEYLVLIPYQQGGLFRPIVDSD